MKPQNPGLAQINLIMCEDVPAEEPRILLRNVNLTDSFVGYTTSSSTSSSLSSLSPLSSTSLSSERLNPAFVPLAPMRKPCLFSSLLLDWSSNSETGIEASSYALESEAMLFFGIRLRALPTTICMTHGRMGYLPLEYVRALPEYTCITRYMSQGTVKVAHIFEDCRFAFPLQNAQDSRQLGELIHGNRQASNTCNRCCMSLAGLAMYMYRDNAYCNPNCRYAAHVAHCLHDRTMNYGEK